MPRLGLGLLILYAVALPLTATAGAWKQPAGEGFAATSFTLRNLDSGLQGELSYYRDYGLTPRFDLGFDFNQLDTQSGHALVFLRLPLQQGADTTQIAAGFALGGSHFEGDWQPMYRLTLSAGRSFQTSVGSLWGSLDLILEQRGSAASPIGKLDGSFGLDTGHRFSPLLQIETAFGSDLDFSYAIIPSLRIKLNDLNFLGKQRFSNSDLTIGLEYRRTKTQSLGLKIAMWRRF
ncbi:hypothetical protein [Pseudophaeobacter sp.]|uniref:hypothetical protein n=1 Tax=Pseudophaeobacter sp. TaxID=1971739 RepID=UPI003298B774